MPRIFVALLAMTLLVAAAPLSPEQDHQRLLDLLKIKSLRPAVANTDEAKANPNPDLPDPLKMKDGKPVDTKDKWWQLRRDEIAEDFDVEVYGGLPGTAPLPVWSVTDSANEMVGRVPAVTRHVVGKSVRGAGEVDIRLTVTLPAKAKGPVPVILELALGDAKSSAPSTWRQQVLAKGWGAAVLDVTSVQPDSAEGLTGGIIGLTYGKPRELGEWGALRAWGWGASRAMDFFEGDPKIQSDRVGIMGHGRAGKAALVAMAYDPRFVVAFISSSGAGGAAPLRRHYGEGIEDLASTSEYYLFGGAFLKYAGPKTPNDLWLDSNLLIAMCAPRPVFIGAGGKADARSDPRGMFMAEVAAGPVYRLLGAKDLGTTKMPPIGKAVTSGALAFRQHAGGSTAEPNWPVFIAYAQRTLDAPRKH